jgi:hypothetical protein
MSYPVFPIGTTEYVIASVTSDLVLSNQVVAIVIEETVHPATWLGTEGTTRSCRTTSPITFTEPTWVDDLYEMQVRITDTPEVPLVPAGYIRVKV